MSIATIKNLVTGTASKAMFNLRKISPEIATGAGLLLGAGCVVAACVQTTKLSKPVDEAKEKLDDIRMTHKEKPEEYTDKEMNADIVKVYARTGVDIMRLYALPAALGAASAACIVSGHNILRKENAALAGAYIALDKSYREYRKRVREDAGEEKDRLYYRGEKVEKMTAVDMDTGEVSTKTAVNRHADPVSPYARFFDKGNPHWSPSPSSSLVFLKGVQEYCNSKLICNGHLFLNEVYDELGIPRSVEGQYVGWVYRSGRGDSKIDFGIWDYDDPKNRAFVNGYEDTILLDFNVDGPIMHILKPEKEDDLRACGLM